MEKYLIDVGKATQAVYQCAYREGYEQAKLDLARRLRVVANASPDATAEMLRIVNDFVTSRPSDGDHR